MTTTQNITSARTTTPAGKPGRSEADDKEIRRVCDLIDTAGPEQAGRLEAHLRTLAKDADVRAYERVATKLDSWATTARIMGNEVKAAEYAALAAERREIAACLAAR